MTAKRPTTQPDNTAGPSVTYYGRTRMKVPQQSLVDRPRLLSLLKERRDARLVSVQAPAGYGKTSLLQQWAQHCITEGPPGRLAQP